MRRWMRIGRRSGWDEIVCSMWRGGAGCRAAGHLFALGETCDRFTYFLLLSFLSFAPSVRPPSLPPSLPLAAAIRTLSSNGLVTGFVIIFVWIAQLLLRKGTHQFSSTIFARPVTTISKSNAHPYSVRWRPRPQNPKKSDGRK